MWHYKIPATHRLGADVHVLEHLIDLQRLGDIFVSIFHSTADVTGDPSSNPHLHHLDLLSFVCMKNVDTIRCHSTQILIVPNQNEESNYRNTEKLWSRAK